MHIGSDCEGVDGADNLLQNKRGQATGVQRGARLLACGSVFALLAVKMIINA